MKYVANPVEVEAFRITELGPTVDIGQALMIEDCRHVVATPEMLARIKPAMGDYWVVQSDGYTYLNPKAVFERKYSPKREYPIVMYRRTEHAIESTPGIIDAAHEAAAVKNGWSREKPELPGVTAQAPASLEERVAALEAKLAS